MSEKILVVVDFQSDFVDGALGFPSALALDEGIAAKVQAYMDQGSPIVVTLDTHQPDYLSSREGIHLPVEHCISGSPGHALYGKTGALLNTYPKAIVVEKETFGVSPTTLTQCIQPLFQPQEIAEVEFVGLVSNICVLSNLCCFQAMWPQAQMVVDAALTDSFDVKLNGQTLDILRGIQVEIRNSPHYLVAYQSPEQAGPTIQSNFPTESLLEAMHIAGVQMGRGSRAVTVFTLTSQQMEHLDTLTWQDIEARKVWTM